ncbi:SAM-dependent methyltransferase [Octadecabacter sp. 1_MG-2023]|uniref:class I SAM-dependent methyltransferase n=1 Tax=unclassified Octadecabacter TaxID=196158 RepID=UPI001C09B66E|nr:MULTISPECIES: SAM-dependent methyltransferase [unclassified Octadecabacter]MBU2991951.1 SAM-dependent methyltransferase [Octadecabacter sp. B2R22]MDO6735925.1 SAM-dependent methyltransferase [Octadecabacter sp. 1_MG-2023]
MTALSDLLTARIAADGPMNLADYMAEALMHPEHGYYSTRDPLGAAGDFITAPEISQMFGELIGLALVQAWIDQGQPNPFCLAELGPGRGTLMADLLRATAKVPGFHAAAQVHLVETSPTLRAEQAKRVSATWHDGTTTLPDQPLFLIANEFFDALPIRQFQRDGSGWREVMVTAQGDALAKGLSPTKPIPELKHRLDDTRDGDIVEICPALPPITSTIASRIDTHGGIALIIDYGDWRSLGDTVQAVQNHAPVDAFTTVGEADITAHVDFEAISLATSPAKFTRLTPQGVFLERLGITQRAQTLAAPLSGDALDTLVAAHRRLTDPAEMGSLFKVIGIYPNGAPPPAGLEP